MAGGEKTLGRRSLLPDRGLATEEPKQTSQNRLCLRGRNYMPKLKEVFGISNAIPQYTYVDRSGLDTTFSYSMQCDRHIVLHGGSKQGKTVLRRKNLSEDRSIVVQCNATIARADIYEQILATLKISLPTSSSIKASIAGEADGKVGFSLFSMASSEVAGKLTKGSETTQTQQSVGIDAKNVQVLVLAREWRFKSSHPHQ